MVRVVHVIDGDTVKVERRGEVESVRLLGLDCPEVDHPDPVVRCLAEEARDFLRKKAEGEFVAMEADPTNSDRDRYGRLLRYLWLSPSAEFLNLEMIRRGYGYVLRKYPIKQMDQFEEAQRFAMSKELGLWSSSCGTTQEPRKQADPEATVLRRALSPDALAAIEELNRTQGRVPPEAAGTTYPRQRRCCRYCSTGKPCGDSCIAINEECQKPAGCAC